MPSKQFRPPEVCCLFHHDRFPPESQNCPAVSVALFCPTMKQVFHFFVMARQIKAAFCWTFTCQVMAFFLLKERQFIEEQPAVHFAPFIRRMNAFLHGSSKLDGITLTS
jgi:hypothetical protein